MDRILIAAGLLVASLIVVVPLVVIMLVSFASVREESARSLGGAAPSLAARFARRVLGFHGDLGSAPRSGPTRKPQREVRFAYARRTLPDSGSQPASRQPRPRPIRLDKREPARV